MKKLLLSSIIMFGVCGIAAAQKGTDSKVKTRTQTTSSIAPAPQKSATAAQAAASTEKVDPTVVDPYIDKAPVAGKTAAAATPAKATTVNEAGVVETVNPDIQKKAAIKQAQAKSN